MPIKICTPRKYSILWELADIDVPLTCVLYKLVSVQCFSSDGFIMLDSSFSLGITRSTLCLFWRFGSISDGFATFATSFSLDILQLALSSPSDIFGTAGSPSLLD